MVTSVAGEIELLTRPKISPVTVPGVFPVSLVNENKKLSAVAGPKVAASSKTEPARCPMNFRYMIRLHLDVLCLRSDEMCNFCKVTPVRLRLEGSRKIEQRSSRSPRTLIRGRAVAKAPTLWLHGSCLDCQPIRMATARVASFIVTMCPPMAVMLPLAGTENSVCLRFMGRPRCQTLEISALITQQSRKRYADSPNPCQWWRACYFLDKPAPSL